MKMSKRFAALGLAAAMILSLAACGSSSSDATSTASTATGSSDGEAITLVMSQRDQFLSTLESAASDAASNLGVALSAQDANSDSNKVLQFIDAAKSSGQKAIIINMVDPETASTCIEQAGDMKVVFVNRVPADTSVLTDTAVYVGSDENTSGYYQGEFLSKYFKEQGKTEINYLMLNGILGQTSTTLRSASVLKALEDGGITATAVTEPLACDYDRAEAMNQVSSFLESGKEFDCIISNNDEMALGAIEALESKGIDPASIPIVGIDCTADGAQAVKDGKMAMTVFQNPVGQGSGAVQAALNLINGDDLANGTEYEVDSETGHILWVPFEPVTADNVDDYM